MNISLGMLTRLISTIVIILLYSTSVIVLLVAIRRGQLLDTWWSSATSMYSCLYADLGGGPIKSIPMNFKE